MALKIEEIALIRLRIGEGQGKSVPSRINRPAELGLKKILDSLISRSPAASAWSTIAYRIFLAANVPLRRVPVQHALAFEIEGQNPADALGKR